MQILILMNVFFNIDFISRTLNSIKNQKHQQNITIIFLENPSVNSDKIKHLAIQNNIEHYICDENIAGKIFHLYINLNIDYINKFDYVVITESDVVLDSFVIDEQVFILNKYEDSGCCFCGVKCNLPKYSKIQDKINTWIQKPIIKLDYSLGHTGFQFIMFKTNYLIEFINTLNKKKISSTIARGSNNYNYISDTNLYLFNKLKKIKNYQTKYNKLDHIGWETAVGLNKNYEILKNHYLSNKIIRNNNLINKNILSKIKTMNLIAIQSCPRSGSSWLLSLFDSLENTKILFQPLFSHKFKNYINNNSTKEDFNNFLELLYQTNDDFCCMNSNLHVNNSSSDIPKYNKTSINTLVMKHVTHNNLIEKYIELYPNIKIIGLIRNPKSVIYSQINAKKENLKDWLNGEDKNISEEYFFGFNKWLETKKNYENIKQKYPNNIIIINYEDLVYDTINEIKKILIFCNLEFTKNIKDCINLTKSKNDDNDYSVYKTEDTINKWKDLNKDIIEYIDNNSKLNIAICTNFNDIISVSGIKKKNLMSVKSFLSYKQQFDILYKSIKTNLKSVNYKIYIFNTIPFSKELDDYYKKEGITVITRQSEHEYFNRPEIYLEKIDCDYKLVIDVDTIIVNDFDSFIIDYIKKYDCMGTYGYRNINQQSYKNILKKLNLKVPNEINNLKNNNNYGWTNVGTYSLNLNNENIYKINRKFPYFNNGCIIIKNNMSYELGKLWKIKRYEAFKKKILPNIGQCGELTIGLCINHLIKNWNHCPKGINLVCSPQTKEYLNLAVEEFTKPYIIHYVCVSYKSNLYKKYLQEYMEEYINEST